MMRKIVAPESQNLDVEQVAVIPLPGSRKLGEHDRKQLLTRADEALLEKFARLHVPAGEVPIHIVALGAHEFYGPNRNGDTFYERVCREYHPTFTKSARFYRGHNSGPHAPFYGHVKLSHYNEKMHRVELIATLLENEAAARRAGPRAKVADAELQKIASGDTPSTSMGCVVSHDICSGCGHKAKTPKEYCDSGSCKQGGLHRNMGRLLADGSVLCAINPDPNFNDISHVKRGADRISFVMGVLRKAATDRTIGGAELAELLYQPDFPTKLALQARKLAEIEADLSAYEHLAPGCSMVGRRNNFILPQGVDSSLKLAQVLAAAADQNIILPAREFVTLIAGDPKVGQSVKLATAGLFDRLTPPMVNPFECRGPIPGAYQLWATRLAPDYSFEKSAVSRRIGLATLRDVPISLAHSKQASDDQFAEELAQQYGLYVMAALSRRERTANLGLTTALSLLQNRLA